MPDLPTDDRLITPPDELNNAPAGARRTHPITCEFCESRLAPNGDIISMGARAKELRKANETIENLRAEVATLTRERDELATAVRAAKPRKEKGWLEFGGDE